MSLYTEKWLLQAEDFSDIIMWQLTLLWISFPTALNNIRQEQSRRRNCSKQIQMKAESSELTESYSGTGNETAI